MFFFSTMGNLIKKGKTVLLQQIYIYIIASQKAWKLSWNLVQEEKKKKAWLAPVFVKCSEIHGDRAISWQPPSHSVSRRRPWARARPGDSIRKLQMATCAILINELLTWRCRFQETPAGKTLYNKLRPSNWKITDSTVSFSGSFGKEIRVL